LRFELITPLSFSTTLLSLSFSTRPLILKPPL
jgi:hypothetical protein